jgi:hypothetical protein
MGRVGRADLEEADVEGALRARGAERLMRQGAQGLGVQPLRLGIAPELAGGVVRRPRRALDPPVGEGEAPEGLRLALRRGPAAAVGVDGLGGRGRLSGEDGPESRPGLRREVRKRFEGRPAVSNAGPMGSMTWITPPPARSRASFSRAAKPFGAWSACSGVSATG